MTGYRVAVVGATGAVGTVMLQKLRERNFPAREIVPFASERSAGRFDVDVLQLSDVSPAIDFQKKGGWEQYVSPEYAAYKPEHQSTPAGYYGVPGVGFAPDQDTSTPWLRRCSV